MQECRPRSANEGLVMASILANLGRPVIVATPTKAKRERKPLPPICGYIAEVPTGPSPEERQAELDALRAEREKRRAAEAAREAQVRAGAAEREQVRVKAQQALVAKRRAAQAAKRQAGAVKPTVAGPVEVEKVKDLEMPRCDRGIFPGHPLYPLYIAWLDGRKPSKTLTKRFLKTRKAT